MKIAPPPKTTFAEPDFTLADEVFFVLGSAEGERRVLLTTAVLLMAQCVIAGLPFELVSLHRDPIAQYRDGILTAPPLLTAAAEDAAPAVRLIMDQARDLTLAAVRAELVSEQDEDPPAGADQPPAESPA